MTVTKEAYFNWLKQRQLNVCIHLFNKKLTRLFSKIGRLLRSSVPRIDFGRTDTGPEPKEFSIEPSLLKILTNQWLYKILLRL